MAGYRLRPVLTSKDLTVPNNPADVVMTSEIAEGQRTRLRVGNQKEMQTTRHANKPLRSRRMPSPEWR